MDTSHKNALDTFTLDTLPDLDDVVLGALELFADTPLPQIDFGQFSRPLVVGSGNAAVTGKILFGDTNAVFADESSYVEKLDSINGIDGAVLISASGSKHAVEIATTLHQRQIETHLLTNNADAPAKEVVGEDNTRVFPKNREPYTYNTSTYLGMILAKTGEDPAALHEFLTSSVGAGLPDTIGTHDAYYFMVPERFDALREMFQTKFDELFGPRLIGRIFTEEQTKHAKTVVPMESELFVSFGVENTHYGSPSQRLHIPLPDSVDYGALMMIGYYVIGHIQKYKPPYFKDRIEEYTREISQIFDTDIRPIVE